MAAELAVVVGGARECWMPPRWMVPSITSACHARVSNSALSELSSCPLGSMNDPATHQR